MAARKTTVGPSRWHNDEGYIDQHIRPRLGAAELTSITAPHLNALYADIRDNGQLQRGAPLAPSTVLRAYVILHKAFADAVQWGYLDHDPADTADPPSQRITEAARRTSIRIWTAEQIKRFEGLSAERSDQNSLCTLAARRPHRPTTQRGLAGDDEDDQHTTHERLTS